MRFISEAKWSVGNRIFNNLDKIKVAKSKREIEYICIEALKGMNNKDAKLFIYNLYHCTNKDDAISFCYNYYLAGLGARVI